MPSLTRRRFIAVSAAAGLAPASAAGGSTAVWRGIALGAHAELRISEMKGVDATPIFASVVDEISRLEKIFSLFRPDSEINRLNHQGYLEAPPAELLEVLSLATALHRATDRAFDPTIHVLWRHLSNVARAGKKPIPGDVRGLKETVNWNAVHFDSSRVFFDRRGMSITLNGIAQGFITDRIASKLRAFGVRNVLVDMGELYGQGTGPNASPWSAAIADPNGGPSMHRVMLRDRALATSAPLGTVLDQSGKVGHIIDPRIGLPASGPKQVSVSAETAAVADGLSTALCLLDRSKVVTALRAFEGARLESRIV